MSFPSSSLRLLKIEIQTQEGEFIKYLALLVLCICLPVQARTQPQMLFVTQANCKLIKGYSKNDIAGVSKEFNVPMNKIRFVKTEWGRGQGDFEQCNMIFSTPKGNKSCKVFNIMKDDFIFGLAVPIPGNHAICN